MLLLLLFKVLSCKRDSFSLNGTSWLDKCKQKSINKKRGRQSDTGYFLDTSFVQTHFTCGTCCTKDVLQTEGSNLFSEPTFRFLLVTSVPYGVLEITSGAIQYGVPTRDFLFGTSLLIWAQNPKSDSFICRRRKGKSCSCCIIVPKVSRKNSSGCLFVFVLRVFICCWALRLNSCCHFQSFTPPVGSTSLQKKPPTLLFFCYPSDFSCLNQPT